jgi:hypothetical protein
MADERISVNFIVQVDGGEAAERMRAYADYAKRGGDVFVKTFGDTERETVVLDSITQSSSNDSGTKAAAREACEVLKKDPAFLLDAWNQNIYDMLEAIAK